MLKSISAYFDHNAKKILEVSERYKDVALISAFVAFYNLVSFFSPDQGGAMDILIVFFSSLFFWVCYILRKLLKLVAKIADKISKTVKTTDEVCDIAVEVVTEAFNKGEPVESKLSTDN